MSWLFKVVKSSRWNGGIHILSKKGCCHILREDTSLMATRDLDVDVLHGVKLTECFTASVLIIKGKAH